MPEYLNFINYFLENAFIVTGLTYSVLILELGLFLGLFASIRYRKFMLVFAIGFHLLIILFHGIFSFFFSISAALILYLYPTYVNIDFKNIKQKLKIIFLYKIIEKLLK